MNYEGKFIVPHPSGYGLVLSYFLGTGVDDVPSSLILISATELLSEDALEKLKEVQTEIDEVEELLRHLPKTTFEEELQRVKPKIRLSELNAWKRAYLREPRKKVARELAHKAYKHYCNYLDSKLAELKKSLPQTKHRDIGAFFKRKLGDPRYLGYSFRNLIPRDERQEVEKWVQGMVQVIYEEWVPPELQKYINHHCQNYLFALPHAEYSLEWNISCLDFGFDLYLVAEVEFREVEEANDVFYGYQFPIRFTGDLLGRLYKIFRPSPDHVFWQTISVTLVQSLLDAELIPKGAKILSSGSYITEYEVEGFQVTIPDDFGNYLAEVGTKGGLATFGIIEQKTASVIEHLPHSVSAEASAKESNVDNGDVIAALEILGYKKGESKKAIEAAHLSPGMSLEEMVGAVLKNIGM